MDKDNKPKEGHGKLWGGGNNFLSFVFLEVEENECVRKELVVMCEEMLFMETKGVQKNEHGRKLCVASSHSVVHRMISMNKPLDVLLK